MFSALLPPPPPPKKGLKEDGSHKKQERGWLNYPDSARACLPNTELPFKVGEGANWDKPREASLFTRLGVLRVH